MTEAVNDSLKRLQTDYIDLISITLAREKYQYVWATWI